MKYLLIILLASCTTTKTVMLDSSKSYDPDGQIVSGEWRVIQGYGVIDNVNGVSIKMKYKNPVTVELIVTDDKGAIGKTTKIIK